MFLLLIWTLILFFCGIAGTLLVTEFYRWIPSLLFWSGTITLAIVLFLLSIRRSGEHIGRIAERLETTEKANEIRRRMLEAAARRPPGRDALADRLRDGRF